MSKYEDNRVFILTFALWIIAFLLIFTTLTHPVEPSTIYITQGNIYKGFFTEPFETLLIVFKDGDFITFSSHHAYWITMSFGWLGDFLKKNNKKIKDIKIIIHNHLIPTRFTEGNKYFYRKFKEAGFQGLFCIYYPATEMVKILEDEK